MSAFSGQPVLRTGLGVQKLQGDYTFDGRIVSMFVRLNGDIRAVAENSEGLLYIFAPSQLTTGLPSQFVPRTLGGVDLNQPETPPKAYSVGQKITKKPGGEYTFEGTVVAAFRKCNGAERYVVENDEGIMHIMAKGGMIHKVVVPRRVTTEKPTDVQQKWLDMDFADIQKRVLGHFFIGGEITPSPDLEGYLSGPRGRPNSVPNSIEPVLQEGDKVEDYEDEMRTFFENLHAGPEFVSSRKPIDPMPKTEHHEMIKGIQDFADAMAKVMGVSPELVKHQQDEIEIPTGPNGATVVFVIPKA